MKAKVWRGETKLGETYETIDIPAELQDKADEYRTKLLEAVAETDEVTGTLAGLEPARVVAALVTGGVAVRSFTPVTATLEDAFVQLTGEGFDVSG